MKRIRLALAMIFALGLALCAGPAPAAEKVILRLGHDVPTTHPYHKAAAFLAEKVAAKSGGKITIDVFPMAQLGNEVAMLDSVRAGNLDMSLAAAPNAAAHIPELGLFSVSYLMKDENHFVRVVKDEYIIKRLREITASKKSGLSLVAVFTAGLRHFFAAKELKTPEQMRGVKIRVMASPIEARVWKTIGASPVSMPNGELYTSLQTGLVAAGENSTGGYLGFKHYEVAPYYVLTGHQWLLALLFMSEKTAAKLTADQLRLIADAALEMAEYEVKLNIEMDDKAIAEMPTKYKVKVVQVDKRPFETILAPLQDEVAKELKVEDLLQRVRALGR